jgi:hypothetical protein
MTNSERLTEIKALSALIEPLSEEFNSIVEHDNFSREEDNSIAKKRFLEVSDLLMPLIEKQMQLITEYDVSFSHEGGTERFEIFQNLKIEIDTFSNGWEIYYNNEELNQLLDDIKNSLLNLNYKTPNILELKSKNTD